MSRKLQISAPTDTFPVGSINWLYGMTIRLSNAVRHAETYGIEPIIATAKGLIPHRPWLSVPLDAPYRNADRYFKEAVGMSVQDLASIIEVKDKAAAFELLAACSPGNMADVQQRDRDGKFVNTEVDNVNHGVDNTSSGKTGDGNSRAYTLNRLKRERPDLFELVVAGELSANAAAIRAGFRKKLTPLEQFARLWAKASVEERQLIREFIDSPVFDR